MKLLKIFLAIFISVSLSSCFSRKRESVKTIEQNGMKITISAVSAKDVTAGITGAPHAPIIIPYVTTERSMVIALEIEKGPVMIAESYSGMDELLSKKELDEILDEITVYVSPDKKHVSYCHKTGQDASCRIFHLLDGRLPFFSEVKEEKDPDKVRKNKEPDWKNMQAPEDIAFEMMGDTSLKGDEAYLLWTMVSSLPDDHKLLYRALELWDMNYRAHEVILAHSYDLNKKSDQWKNAVYSFYEKYDKLFSEKYMEQHDEYDRMKKLNELCFNMRDSLLTMKCHAILARGIGRWEDIAVLFNDEYSLYNRDTTTQWALTNLEKQARRSKDNSFRNKPDPSTISNYLYLSYHLNDTIMETQCMTRLCNLWPGDSLVMAYVYSNSGHIPASEKKGMQQKALKIISGKDSVMAVRLLQDICTCEELKTYRKKTGNRKLVTYECPEDTGKTATNMK